MERREYFRIRTFARVGLRALESEELEQARIRVTSRRRSGELWPGLVEESRLPAENRMMLDLLRRVALTLDRIDRRIEEIANRGTATLRSPQPFTQSLEISLSGSGFSGAFDIDLPDAAYVEVELDLWDSGLPIIPAVARLARRESDGRPQSIGFAFEELHADDLEHIIQFCVKSQRETLREARIGEAS